MQYMYYILPANLPFTNLICLIYGNEQDVESNNLQGLMCRKTNQPTNQLKSCF